MNRLKIDKQAVANSFAKAATHYDQFALLQQNIGQQMLDNYAVIKADTILDLGCGTGYFSEKLSRLYPSAKITCFDLCKAMLVQVDKKQLSQLTCMQGDIDKQPFSHNSFDFIFSNLVVQWSEDLYLSLKQLKNILKKEGKAIISTLLMGSLNELTQAWKSIDSFPHTNSFLSLQNVEELLQQANFSKISIKTETRVLHYSNVIEVMRSLKGIGANHVHGHQNVKLSGRKLMRKLEQGYQPFINESGQLNLTYQICYIEVIK